MANSNGKKSRKQSGLNRYQLKGRAAKKRDSKIFAIDQKTGNAN